MKTKSNRVLSLIYKCQQNVSAKCVSKIVFAVFAANERNIFCIKG